MAKKLFLISICLIAFVTSSWLLEKHSRFKLLKSGFQKQTVASNLLNYGAFGNQLKALGLIKLTPDDVQFSNDFFEGEINQGGSVFKKKRLLSSFNFSVSRSPYSLFPSAKVITKKSFKDSLPVLSIVIDELDMYGQNKSTIYLKKTGKIDNLAYVSYFNERKDHIFSTAVGIRLIGESNKAINNEDLFLRKKGFKLYFRREYGLKKIDAASIFLQRNYPINQLIVRAESNNAIILDKLRNFTEKHTEKGSGTRPVIFYLNGLCEGIRYIEERATDFCIEKKYPSNSNMPVPIISEVMYSNNINIVDMDGDSSDWIELYNPSENDTINLKDWYLTDSIDDLKKWKFPAVNLSPKHFILVYLSGKDKWIEGKEIHTNFRLRKAGEYVGLVMPDGMSVASRYPSSISHITDVSYGLTRDKLIQASERSTECRVQEAGYLTASTPGSINVSSLKKMGPIVNLVKYTPFQASDKDSITISAKITPRHHSVETVILHYRRMFQDEQSRRMQDDGIEPDATANDGVYTGIIPKRILQQGEMLRWHISAVDIQGNVTRDPVFQDRSGDRQDPQYYGTIIHDNASKSQLPTFWWFAEDPKEGHKRSGTRASAFYNGHFYDNIYVSQRGRATNATESQKFMFNKGYELFLNQHLGMISTVNLNGPGLDASFMRQPIGFENYRRNGAHASESFLMRIMLNGKFDRVGIFVEQLNQDFLRRNGYDENGALYKFVQRDEKPVFDDLTSILKKTRSREDWFDMKVVIDGLHLKTRDARRAFFFDNFDVPQIINRHAIMIMHREVDSIRKNFYLYRNTFGNREWSMFPWDLDLILGNSNPGKFADHPFLGDRDYPLQPENQ